MWGLLSMTTETEREHLPRNGTKRVHTMKDSKPKRQKKPPAEPPKPMLPPENAIDVAPEGSSEETLDQRRLRELHEAHEMLVYARDRYEALYKRAQDLIISGCAIKQGTYKVDYATRLVRRPKYKQVVIDLKGEEFQKDILEKTRPH